MNILNDVTNLMNSDVYDQLLKEVINPEALSKYGQAYCEQLFNSIISKLHITPSYTTVRFNNSSDISLGKRLMDQLAYFVGNDFKLFQHPVLEDVLVIVSPTTGDVQPYGKEIIVGRKCGEAVLRGANVYVPGVTAAPVDLRLDDPVAVFADVLGKCLRGSVKQFAGEKIFVGNGISRWNRKDLFVTLTARETAIEMTERICKTPCLGDFMPEVYFLQNLPSIVCGHVLEPKPGEVVLDMCAAPGGKTTHIASLMRDRGIVIAVDKTKPKISKIQKNLERFGLKCVKVYAYDSTKLWNPSLSKWDLPNVSDSIEPPFPSETFDRILLDAPCSALGQRPQLCNRMTVKELRSYPRLQKKLLTQALELLKIGGVLVYSTCTFTLQENESMVKWILDNYPHMQLTVQNPHLGQAGLSGAGLSNNDLQLLQRFGCKFDPKEQQVEPMNHGQNVNLDTIGFFIAKLIKKSAGKSPV